MELQVSSSYLGVVYRLNDFTKTVDRTLRVASEIRERYLYDTIAFTGHSGAAMAHILSYRMNVPLLCVRKNNDSSHYVQESGKILEGFLGCKKYLIVDDFIASGETVNRIIKTVASNLDKTNPTCVAMLMYNRAYNPRARHVLNIEDKTLEIPLFGSYHHE